MTDTMLTWMCGPHCGVRKASGTQPAQVHHCDKCHDEAAFHITTRPRHGTFVANR